MEELHEIPETTGSALPEDVARDGHEEPATEETLQLVEGEDDTDTLKAMLQDPKPILEALLFSSSEPLTAERLRQMLRGAGIQNLPKLLEEMNEQFEAQGRVYRVEKLAKGYVLMTLPDYAPWLKKLDKQKVDNRLSQSALETLAVVAYRQPITRAEVDAVRGVSCGPLLKSLIEKGLLRIAGQAEVIGRPLLYGTTQKFLDIFGLGDLTDLPAPAEATGT